MVSDCFVQFLDESGFDGENFAVAGNDRPKPRSFQTFEVISNQGFGGAVACADLGGVTGTLTGTVAA